VGCAAAAAFAFGRSGPAFHVHHNLLAVDRHVSREAAEGPIESFTMAEQRAMKQTAPFQTVADGAAANAMAQRAKKPKSGGAWAPIGSTPLHADSPDYAGSDPVLNSGPSRLGWKGLSGRITAFAYDPANPNRVFA